MLRPTEAVRALAEYHPPLAGREGLRLDFNENTTGCSPRVLARLRRISADDLSRYPERAPVEAAAAEWLGLEAPQVLLTNGVDEGIHLLCETYLGAGAEALVVVPTFSMYAIYAAATGAAVVSVAADEQFRFPLKAALDAISERTRLIAVANPNNPTGTVASREELLRLAQAAPSAGMLVDEAYFDFYGESLMDCVGRVPNLFVARTFSKAYGMAGLRVGVLAGAAEQMAFARRVASPYNVNAAALACLPEALADSDYVRDYTATVRRGRALLEQELAAAGVTCWSSQANFVLARIGECHREFVTAMRARGVLVRDRDHDPGCTGCVRITVGTDEQTERLLLALREVLPLMMRARELTA